MISHNSPKFLSQKFLTKNPYFSTSNSRPNTPTVFFSSIILQKFSEENLATKNLNLLRKISYASRIFYIFT